MADFPVKDIPIGKTRHCLNCETLAREAERWRVRAEQYSAGWDAMGTKAQALVDQLSAENERLQIEAEAHYDRGYYDGGTHLLEQHEALKKARDAAIEECASKVEDYPSPLDDLPMAMAMRNVAAAIRRLKEQSK